MKINFGAAILKLTVHRTLNPERSEINSIYIEFSHWHVMYCKVIFARFLSSQNIALKALSRKFKK